MHWRAWRYRILMSVGLALVLAGAVIWASGEGPTPHFHDNPSSSDFTLGSGTVLVLVGGAAFLYGAWLWSRDGRQP